MNFPDGRVAEGGNWRGAARTGRAEIGHLVRGFYDAFPDTVVIMDAMRELGTKLNLWTYEGTNTGPGGIGKRVRLNGWEAWTLSGDALTTRSIGSFLAEE